MGLKANGDELHVGTAAGVMGARSVKRLPAGQRADPQLVADLKGVPWSPIPGGDEGQEVPPAVVKIVANKVVPDDQRPPVPAAGGGDAIGRGLYIRRNVELRRHGYTSAQDAWLRL